MLAGCLVWIWRLEQREKKFKTLVDFHELFENIMTEYVDYSITIGTPHDEKAERLNRAMYSMAAQINDLKKELGYE